MAAIIPAAAIGTAVGSELPKFFNDALDQFGSGEGVYLRDGDPAGIVGKIGQAVGRSYCRAYDATSSEYPAGKGERIEAACRPYLDSLEPGGGIGIELPFRGGQCAKRYRVDFTFVSGSSCADENPTSKNGFAEVWGPVLGIAVGPNDCPPGFPERGSGLLTAWSQPSGPRLGGPVQGTVAQGVESISITSVQVIDGGDSGNLDDECGNPPPVVVQPDPRPNPQPPPFRFNPEPNVDIDIDAGIDINGDIVFDIGFGPTTIDPFPPGGGGGGDGEPGGGGPAPGDDGAPGGSEGAGGGSGDAEGQAGEGEVLVGVRVEVVSPSPDRARYTDTVDRGVCYVYMGTEGNLALDTSGALVRSPQFFFAQTDFLTHWRVSANNQYILNVTPYYREAT